jgi:hypothetical protein
MLVVPYRENRAVLFKSRLFHRSDVTQFANDYENHRINVTMLSPAGGTSRSSSLPRSISTPKIARD